MKDINETYILVLKEINGLFIISEIEIEDASFIINQIKEAVDNPNNKTVLDIQDIFWDNFDCILNQYNYLYPFEYWRSYIGSAVKPHKWTKEEYEIKLQIELESLKNKTHNIEKEIQNYENNIKVIFSKSCNRYIKQQMLYNAYQKANNDPSIKMYSCESIGWNNFKYDISKDVKISISTNFGYGFSSYFTLLVSYKDIYIVRFSHIAHYYHANMIDIIKCTESYDVLKESWLSVFKYVRDYTNMSSNNPELFIKQYIAKEIDDMMNFLRDIIKNPHKHLSRFHNESDKDNEHYKVLRFVSPMDNNDKILFNVLPSEMDIVFQSEKLAEATYTIEKLNTYGNILTNIYDFINEISNMTIELNHKINKTINSIKNSIDDHLVVLKNKKEEQLKNLNIQKNELMIKCKSIGQKLYPNYIITDLYYIEKGIDTIKEFRKNNPRYFYLENYNSNYKENDSEELNKIYNIQIDKLNTIIDNLFTDISWGCKNQIISTIYTINDSEKKNPEYIQLEEIYKDICRQIKFTDNQIEVINEEISNLENQIYDRKKLIYRLSDCQSTFNNYLSNKA